MVASSDSVPSAVLVGLMRSLLVVSIGHLVIRGNAVDEFNDRAAVPLQRGHRDPLLGAVVTAADRPVLHGRDAGSQEGDRVRGAVAADDAARGPVALSAGGVPQGEDVRQFRVDLGGRTGEGRDHAGPLEPANLREYLAGILLGQVAHVDIDDTGIGNLVQSVAAQDATEVDRRPIEELRALARKR